MPLESIIDDVTGSLRDSRSAIEACNESVAALSRSKTGARAMIAVLLHVQDHLRCVAASGSWQVFSSVPLSDGVVGRAYAQGLPQTVTDLATDPDYVQITPEVVAEICAPILDRAGQPIGVLNAEWTSPEGLEGWQDLLAEVGRLLGGRVDELGGTPAESRGEQLLRHSNALTAAETDNEVLIRACRAAREVTGLAAAVVLRPLPPLGAIGLPASSPEIRDRPLISRLAESEPARLTSLVERAGQHGASYSIGDPALLIAQGFEALTEAGVRTMIAIPLADGVLIALDEEALVPERETVNLLELLGAQASTCLEKLANLRHLHRQATSDPLTGLRHSGPFGHRLRRAIPGRTALLAIDIDEFKSINDTLGHAAGDQVLIDVANALQKALRQGDELFRIGGDEFVAVVDVPTLAVAVGVAERLLEAARTTGRTISLGVAVQTEGETPEQALHRADRALYAAKASGRDAIHVSSTA
ncbi:MAG TPA: GGDEF domain-containing protein [Micromonosporaceae bacterium]|nr:GGDEF domain-containing protein [Micromonosporaceae bacterium]